MAEGARKPPYQQKGKREISFRPKATSTFGQKVEEGYFRAEGTRKPQFQ